MIHVMLKCLNGFKRQATEQPSLVNLSVRQTQAVWKLRMGAEYECYHIVY